MPNAPTGMSDYLAQGTACSSYDATQNAEESILTWTQHIVDATTVPLVRQASNVHVKRALIPGLQYCLYVSLIDSRTLRMHCSCYWSKPKVHSMMLHDAVSCCVDQVGLTQKLLDNAD